MFVPGGESGMQRRIAYNLSHLIQARLAEYFSEVGPVPKAFQKTDPKFLVSACASRSEALKALKVTIAPNMFLQWRQEREARGNSVRHRKSVRHGISVRHRISARHGKGMRHRIHPPRDNDSPIKHGNTTCIGCK